MVTVKAKMPYGDFEPILNEFRRRVISLRDKKFIKEVFIDH